MDNLVKSIIIVGEWCSETRALVSILTSEGIKVTYNDQGDLTQSRIGHIAMFQDVGDEIKIGNQIKKNP